MNIFIRAKKRWHLTGSSTSKPRGGVGDYKVTGECLEGVSEKEKDNDRDTMTASNRADNTPSQGAIPLPYSERLNLIQRNMPT